MKARRLLSLATKSAPFSRKRIVPFSAANPRPSNYFRDEEEEEGVSAAYRHALRFQRPPTVPASSRDLSYNSVSFIGSVCIPPKIMATWNGELGVRAALDVKTSPESEPTLRVSLYMWDEIAQVFLKHFSCYDFIYVSGRLGFYAKPNENGEPRAHYKVIVKELNFVTPRHQALTCQMLGESQGETALDGCKIGLHLWQVFFANPSEWLDVRVSKKTLSHPDFIHKDTGKALWQWPNDPPWIKERLELLDKGCLEKYVNDLYLWRVFFANPNEWYDCRETKKNSRQPDFRHKDTDEALWLNPNNPPWIRKQLESLDLLMENQGQAESGLDKYKDDLHLWQVFFANPDDWWDNRKDKKNHRAPDFKHKDTDEALWLNPDNPPWIKKQLQVLDLRRAEQGLVEWVGHRSRVSLLEYD